jgi:hypothetical protein
MSFVFQSYTDIFPSFYADSQKVTAVAVRYLSPTMSIEKLVKLSVVFRTEFYLDFAFCFCRVITLRPMVMVFS